MLRMSSQIETIVNAYKTLAKIPTVLGGKLNKHGNKVTAKCSIRNFDKGRVTKYVHNYMLDVSKDNIRVVDESDFGMDVSNEILSAVSPTEAFRAVVREEKEGKDNKKQFLEVWSKNTMVHSIDLNAMDVHGEVYSDSSFLCSWCNRVDKQRGNGAKSILLEAADLKPTLIHLGILGAELGGLEWSPDETALVYVAEKKLKKFEPYIKRKAEEKRDNQGDEANLPIKGEEFVYRQDWGEQLVGRHLSVIVVCRLRDESLTVLQGLPESWCPGQVRFTPEGDGVVGVALETEPRRLGLVFCTNRPGYIFQLTLDGTLEKISQEGMSVRSPRFSPAGSAGGSGGSTRLVWLQREPGGPHHACQELVAFDWETRKQSTLIPIVERQQTIEQGECFYGVYCQSLPAAGFSAEGGRLVFSSPQQNEIRTYVLDLQSKSLTDISNRSRPGSTVVLDVKSDVILAVCSNMTTPTQLYAARLPATGQTIEWFQISSPAEVPEVLAKSEVEYLHLEHENSQESVKSFTALYLSPPAPPVEGGRRLPLVVWPHGGPHSSFANGYSLEAALYNMLGFACLQINYRGSTGSGEYSVRYLPARAGVADVLDCKLATDLVLRRYMIDTRSVCLSGGSHGGFLVAHLSGQYPDTYCAVVTRNPVVDVASMFAGSDIPDWCAVEAGYEYSESGPASEEQLLAMRRCSPLAHAHRVRAPTALLLGAGDRRVPCCQGLQYARRLAANGVPTRVYMYEDNHSLSSLPAEMDHLINGANWLLTHCARE